MLVWTVYVTTALLVVALQGDVNAGQRDCLCQQASDTLQCSAVVDLYCLLKMQA